MPDGNDTPNPDELGKQIKDLTAKLEATQKSVDDLTKERDDYKARFEDSKSSRDKAKEKEREEAKKRGEFEEVIKSLEEKIKTLESQTSELDTLKKVKDDYDALQKDIRNDLIAQLPEASREKYADFSIAQLRVVIADLPTSAKLPDVDGSKSGARHLEGKKWADMTGPERIEYARKNTPEAVKLRIKQG